MVTATVNTSSGTLEQSYTYDYLGNRTSKTTDGVTTELTTDLSTGYSQILKATTDDEVIYYTRGFELIARRDGADASYYIYDGGMSVRALSDERGAITDTYVFDAFGNETGRTGDSDNSYGFQGEEQDETGLYYLRARYMDPSTGSFASMDTYAGRLSDPISLHKYMFANSNPVKYCDPSGHVSMLDMTMAIGAQAIIGAEINGILYVMNLNCGDEPQPYDDTEFFIELAVRMCQGAIWGTIFAILGVIASYFLLARITLYASMIIGGFVTCDNATDDLWSGDIYRFERGMFTFGIGIISIGFGAYGCVSEGFAYSDSCTGNFQSRGGYNEAEWLARYIDEYGELPNYYVDRAEAAGNGYNPRQGNLDMTNPGRTLTGGQYYNRNGALPTSAGRVYYEADINYSGGYRGTSRVVYSNDGHYYVTNDHYSTFTEIYPN